MTITVLKNLVRGASASVHLIDFGPKPKLYADDTIAHILYLEGVPNMQRMGKAHVGETVSEQLNLDLRAEQSMLNLYAQGVAHCTNVGDYTTRAMLEGMQKDTDGHIDWIETQLRLIDQVGLERYLSEQSHKE